MFPPDREIKLLGCFNSYLFAPHPFPSCPLTASIKVYFVSCLSYYYVKLFWKTLQKSEKSQKVSKAWKKTNLMVDLHLLHLPREGRRWLRKSGSSWEKSQRQESLVVYQRSKTGTQKQTHFISKRTLMVRMIRCWKKEKPNESSRVFLFRYFEIVSRCLLEHRFQPSTSYCVPYWSMQFYGPYYMESE